MVVEVGLLQLLWGIRSIVGSFVWYHPGQVREPSGLKDVIHSGILSLLDVERFASCPTVLVAFPQHLSISISVVTGCGRIIIIG